MYFNIYLFIYAPTSYLFKIFYHNNKLLKFCSYLCSFAVCFHQEQMLVVLPSLQGRGEVTAGGGGQGLGPAAGQALSVDSTVRAEGRGERLGCSIQHTWMCFPGCTGTPIPGRGFQVHLKIQGT